MNTPHEEWMTTGDGQPVVLTPDQQAVAIRDAMRYMQAMKPRDVAGSINLFNAVYCAPDRKADIRELKSNCGDLDDRVQWKNYREIAAEWCKVNMLRGLNASVYQMEAPVRIIRYVLQLLRIRLTAYGYSPDSPPCVPPGGFDPCRDCFSAMAVDAGLPPTSTAQSDD